MKNVKQGLLVAMCALATSSLSAQQKDWAGFDRYAAANSTVEVPARVVFMGNSITEGWWNLDSLYFKNNRYVARGISGQVSSQMLVRFRQDVLNLRPKAVVILAGTNDIAQNNGFISLENTLGNIISMAELAKAHGIRVVLCSVMPAADFKWRPGLQPAQKIVQLNRMIRAYAEQNGLTYVDYHTALADEQGGLPKSYSLDGVHPTRAGYKVMEELVDKALKMY